jgi:glutathione S-transferase
MSETREDVVLTMSRRFAAPREKVFDAWTNADVLKQWWAAAPTMDTPVAEVDAREGGRYRLSMRDTGTGETHTLVGEYREITPPERLVYTWTWETNAEAMHGSEETLVEVDFREDGDGTEVVVTHSGFAGPEIRDLHVQGWEGVLGTLERKVFPS